MGKTYRCDRCNSRWRGQANWNATHVAGLQTGVLCPKCQTSEEHVEAEANDALTDYSKVGDLRPASSGDDAARFIESLLRTYPTPDVMRSKAAELAAARSDDQAQHIAGIMRRMADDPLLWEDNGS